MVVVRGGVSGAVSGADVRGGVSRADTRGVMEFATETALVEAFAMLMTITT